MSENTHIFIVDEDPASRKAWSAFLDSHPHFAGFCAIFGPEEVSGGLLTGAETLFTLGPLSSSSDALKQYENTVHFDKPVRFGAVLDKVGRVLKAQQKNAYPENIDIGSWRLDTVYNVLNAFDGADADIRLTEKEKEILCVLHDNGGQPVSREDLLRAVWAYAEGVETHTLETHIYRLRQKIEDDPAAPQILLKNAQGYSLAGF